MPLHTPKRILLFLVVTTCYLTSCDRPETAAEPPSSSLQGTWELVSETKIENGDTTHTAALTSQRMIKIINETHFAFLRHDLTQGKDSAALFVAGGGPYTIEGKKYTEHLEYCSARSWENNTFHFSVEIRNDTLVQEGREKIEGLNVDRIIIEKYKRVSQ